MSEISAGSASRKPRILFIALAQSTHTQAWVDLADPAAFDVKVFGVGGTRLPDGSSVEMVAPPARLAVLGHRVLRRVLRRELVPMDVRALVRFIREWQPDIVHTLGLDPASYFYLDLRRRMGPLPPSVWVVTARGGPELTLHRLLPQDASRIADVVVHCDQFIADNELNYQYATELGLAPGKAAPFGRMPGVGGIDIDELHARRTVSAAASRLILMPKAYECPASKVLPVFEALRVCWDRIQPVEIHFTAATPEAQMWFATLPTEIRARCHIYDRLPRERLLALMARARVMLAPSLTDGVPNVLYEAMASGCLPILSPLETLRPLVEDGANVLFARNLYPAEIAAALVRAMTDDSLVEGIVARNRELVRRLADRRRIREVVVENYRKLAARRATAARA